MKKILVLGSLNIDLVQTVPRLPVPGETLTGGDLRIFVGGKGANQAYAAALLGGSAQMAGSVGNDVFAARLTTELERAGVDTSLVRTAEAPSGSATIFVLPSGENVIVLSPGANADVPIDFALRAVESLSAGDFLLCQLEIPLDTVLAAMKAAYERGVVTILDPAPARLLPAELFAATSILTPNQTEAALLAGASKSPENMEEATVCARDLRTAGAHTVIVKMGEHGCLIVDEHGAAMQSGFRVQAVDTTAAGDTFNGALAVALAEGATMHAAAAFANAAAALSVTKPGAISSIPTREEVERFRNR